MAAALPTFPSFDPNVDLGAPGVRFKKYISRFRNLLTATNITDPKRQKALLLHYAGAEVNDIFETLTISEPTEGETDLDVTIKALSDSRRSRILCSKSINFAPPNKHLVSLL